MAPRTTANSKPLTKTNRITKKAVAASKAASKEKSATPPVSLKPAPAKSRKIDAKGPNLDVNSPEYDAIWKSSKRLMGKPSECLGRASDSSAPDYQRLNSTDACCNSSR